MRKSYLLILFVLLSASLTAQKFKSDQSTVIFFSDATIEDITATNEKSASIFDSSTGEIAFLITITDFQFEKSLMQEHFNEKYMESDKFPKATFKGRVSGFEKAVATAQQVNAKGTLTIHGQSKEVNVNGMIEKNGENLVLKSKFMVELADFKIKIPQLLWQNIAERVEVTVNFTYKAL